MKEKLRQLGSLKLGRELEKNEMKKVVGGQTCYTECADGDYYGFCQAAYCEAADHGAFLGCSDDCGGGGL